MSHRAVSRTAGPLVPEHLFTIVNGDIQYLDLIAEFGQDWDLLGINAYRGISFEAVEGQSLWEDVKTGYDKPIVFMEFGSDAFNARDLVEDQRAQAEYLTGQWHEMYRKAYGQGEQGNSVGGFVFGLSQLMFAWIVFKTIRGGEKASGQVWEGADGLEWTLSSAPPYHSANEAPEIT